MGRPKKSAPVLHEPEEESQETPDEEPARVIDEDDPEEEPVANGSISKAQAVRNALAEGHEEPGDIADFARKHYGLVIANQQVSAYKSQAKARAKKAATSDDDGEDSEAGPSKTDLIREAVEAGYEKPALGVAYIKKQHGVEIDSKYYSIVKGKLGKAGDQPTVASAAATPAPHKAAAAAPSNGSTAGLPGSLFDDLKQLRDLKDRYGDDFQKIVDAIG